MFFEGLHKNIFLLHMTILPSGIFLLLLFVRMDFFSSVVALFNSLLTSLFGAPDDASVIAKEVEPRSEISVEADGAISIEKVGESSVVEIPQTQKVALHDEEVLTLYPAGQYDGRMDYPSMMRAFARENGFIPVEDVQMEGLPMAQKKNLLFVLDPQNRYQFSEGAEDILVGDLNDTKLVQVYARKPLPTD